MHYVCIEENKVISVLSYEPGVPESVQVVQISDQDAKNLNDQTHRFDIPTKTVVPVDASILAQKELDNKNAVERDFLSSTDWQVLRHLRQKALGQTPSLTEAEYLALEQQRADAANRIV